MQLPGPAGQPRGGAPAAKARLRAEVSSTRAARAEDPRAAAGRTANAVTACAGSSVVACYLSRPDEPDTTALIRALADGGVRVLVPVLRREPDWAWFTGFDELVPGPHRILQPAGPRLGASALALADWIWLPGLAGAPDGRRLGTGGGWYDRALEWAAPSAPVGMLLFDGELLDAVPTEPWDRRVDWILTSSATVRTEYRGPGTGCPR